MNAPPDGPPQGVPTLTEIVAWPDSTPAPTEGEPASAPPRAALPSDAELTEQVLTAVQRQLDLMIEYRLREALTPLLARATDNLVRDARSELASTLRDVVARAVANELARHRGS